MNLSNSLIGAVLPSGNHAVYEVQPQHMNLQHCSNMSLNQVAIELGVQVAVKNAGRWFKPGMRDEITDPKAIELLDAKVQA